MNRVSWRAIFGALLVSATASWVATVLGGLDAGRGCAAGCVAAATLVLRALTPAQDQLHAPGYGVDRAVVRHPYPRFGELVSTVGWAVRDRRYFDRKLTPLLDRIATEVDDPTPVDALRAETAEQLARFERRHGRWT